MNNLLNELRQLAKEGKLETLTVAKAKELKGKRIQTIYFGYDHQDGADDFIVGEIVSEYDLAKEDTNCEKFANRAEYWESYMRKEQLLTRKKTMMLMTINNRSTYIASHFIVPLNKQDDFTCSDSDRYVQFRVVEDEN